MNPTTGSPPDGLAPNASGVASRGLLLEHWNTVRRHKMAIGISAAFGALAGLLFALPQAPVYRAHTSIKIAGRGDAGSEALTGYIETQLKIIQSESLKSKVAAALTAGNPAYQPGLPEKFAGWRQALGLHAPSRKDSIALAASTLVARAMPNTAIMDVVCESTDRRVAADFANTLADSYIRQNQADQTKRSNPEAAAGELADAKAKLDKSLMQLEASQRASDSAGPDATEAEDSARMLAHLAQLRSDRELKQARYELTKSRNSASLPEIADDSSIKNYQSQLSDLQKQLAQLKLKYTPAHPRVQEIEAKISEVEGAMEKQRSVIVHRIQNDYETAAQLEQKLKEDYERQAAGKRATPNSPGRLEGLRREVDANQRAYDSLLQRARDSRDSSIRSSIDASVIDPAAPPRFPVKPNVFGNLQLGLAAGLLLGLGFAVVWERTDRAIRSPGEASTYIHAAELGVIPLARAKRAGGVSSDVRVELLTWKDKSSVIAEAFRVTAASILFAGMGSDPGRKSSVLVLTSTAPMEGKSTVASNLALALAETRNRVLLIDADMRKPRLQEIFSTTNENGLTNLLQQEEPLDQSLLERYVRPSGVSGASFLSSGPGVESLSELLYSPRMAELLRLCRQLYNFVLIDTPPMLDMPDARILGRLADKVILVVRAGKTTREALVAAGQRLAEDRTPLLGTILNGWDARSHLGHGYQPYGKSYYAYHNTEGK